MTCHHHTFLKFFYSLLIMNADPGCIAVGIDLGTTNSCGYYSNNHEYLPITNENGDHLFPSFVSWISGTTKAGSAAKTQRHTKRGSVVYNSKRIIGRPFSNNEVQDMLYTCGVKIISDNVGRAVFEVPKIGNISPINVGTEIIKEILKRAYEVSGKRVSHVVVTVPANFDNNQRLETKTAVEKAGITSSHILMINEPMAASLCFHHSSSCGGVKNVLVYDFGGGTFDVTIMKVSKTFDVVVHDGDNHLGGSDIDSIVAHWIEDLYKKCKHNSLLPTDISDSIRTRLWNKLLDISEMAKIQLSTQSTTLVDMSTVVRMGMVRAADDMNDDEEIELELSQSEFERRIESRIEETMNVVRRAITSASMNKGSIDYVILVGGSSRIPLVKKKLKDFFGNNKVVETNNPDECVAEGACRYFYETEVVKERTAFSLNTGVQMGLASCIIPKNTEIPCSREETYYTVGNFQREVSTAVYQGRCEKAALTEIQSACIQLHPYKYNLSTISMEKVPLLTRFEYSGDGIVYVTEMEAEGRKVLVERMPVSFDNINGKSL